MENTKDPTLRALEELDRATRQHLAIYEADDSTEEQLAVADVELASALQEARTVIRRHAILMGHTAGLQGVAS
jgi:cysteine synthase